MKELITTQKTKTKWKNIFHHANSKIILNLHNLFQEGELMSLQYTWQTKGKLEKQLQLL